ncbi:hypothetical protein [Nonomuraea zeae]|uniref:Uncharacterized protein n=1 Tax=Nonomuraea zeae TaxID=1642303 RepID=A0A5S4FE43_9ACTN|nr:hypothetical protein [Nonomuraea zeae]TMR16680.1 hypothetical protein ETD85_54985 [Nonomuraea zeae]
MNKRLLPAAVILVLVLSLALAACGGAPAPDDGVVSAATGPASASATASASPSATMDADEAALKFAQCMREHGVDMADPKGGRLQLMIPEGTDKKKAEQADKACRPIMESAVRDRATPSQEDFDRMLKFAQCMREHGIDMADPKPGEGLRVQLKGSKDKLDAAHKACEKYGPGFGKPRQTPGGGQTGGWQPGGGQSGGGR